MQVRRSNTALDATGLIILDLTGRGCRNVVVAPRTSRVDLTHFLTLVLEPHDLVEFFLRPDEAAAGHVVR